MALMVLHGLIFRLGSIEILVPYRLLMESLLGIGASTIIVIHKPIDLEVGALISIVESLIPDQDPFGKF